MWQSDYLETDDIKIHYTRTGGDKPPLVLLHGLIDQGMVWQPVADILEADYDVIMPDARGHGLSGVPEDDYSWLSLAEDVQRLIAGLNINKPIILGHSMGALSALLFAAKYPDVPKAILLEDPPAHWTADAVLPEYTEEAKTRFTERLNNLKPKSLEQIIADQKQESPNWSDEALAPWAEAKHRVSMNVLHIFKSNADWSDRIGNVSCPALLITGDPELGAIVTAETAQVLKSLIPHVQVEQIAGASHNIRRDQQDAYMDVVTQFLNSL